MKHNQLVEEDQDPLTRSGDYTNDPKTVQGGGAATTAAPGDEEKAAKKKKIIKWAIIIALIVIIVTLAIALPLALRNNDEPDNPVNPPVPPHYNPYVVDDGDITESTSGLEGILKASSYSADRHQNAYQSLYSRMLKDSNSSNTTSNSTKLGVHSDQISLGVNNNFTSQVKFQFGMNSYRIARLLMTDNNDQNRYSIDDDIVNKPGDDQNMRLEMLGFQFSKNPFYFSFSDNTQKDNTYVTTQDCSLVFMDKFIQMDFTLPSQRIYGFGERIHEFQLQEGTWTMWAKGGDLPQYDDGTGRKGTYGVHPFILVQGKNKGDYFGMYFRNSDAQSPVIRYNTDGTSTLSYITIGGNIEIYFFIHGSAKDVISAYQRSFGTPQLPPFWSLGWQQSSYKWSNQSMVSNVIANYTKYSLPLDAVYLDIPYMDKFLDFTVDTVNFPNITELAELLHNNSMKLVVIVDPFISVENITNKYYELGNFEGLFVKSSRFKSDKYNDSLVSEANTKVVFMDWFHPNISHLYDTGLMDLFNVTNFDGIWVDMNEATTFITGELDHSKITKFRTARFLADDGLNYDWYTSLPQTQNSTWWLPFIPRFDVFNNFDEYTLSLNATHFGNFSQYDLHNLYGHMMARRTKEFLTDNQTYPNRGKIPFVLTRSTTTKSGEYSSHWLGDNQRDWSSLNYSISGIMSMQMFGIPHVGADICGFNGKERNDELCARWIQLATFYPLARFHYSNDSDDNEPFNIQNETYLNIAKRAMLDRYQYLRQVYTCMHEVSSSGGSCIEPLFYYFPNDENVYNLGDSAFMVHGALKVTPILWNVSNETSNFTAYFPNGTWVDLNNRSSVIDTRATGGAWVNLTTNQQSVHTHLKSGSIIAFQEVQSYEQVKNTADLDNIPLQLLINRDDNKYARGSLYLRKGEMQDESEEYYDIKAQANSIIVQLNGGSRGSLTGTSNVIETIKFLNSQDLIDKVNKACYVDQQMKPHPLQVSQEQDNITLTLYSTDEKLYLANIFSIHYGEAGDLDPCDIDSFHYQIKDGQIPDYSNMNFQSIILSHKFNATLDINFTVRITEQGILNIHWTWANDSEGNYPPKGVRTPYEVPTDFVNGKALNNSALYVLGDYISIADQPFRLNVTLRDAEKTAIYTLKGMIFDEYLNWIDARIITKQTGSDYTGVFGLGERVNKDFFFKDGVYSMMNRDQPNYYEDGKTPGKNMYGTHPFYVYKHNTDYWVGVAHNNAGPQDWWITNDNTTGVADISTVTTGGVVDIYVMVGQKPDDVIKQFFQVLGGNPVMPPQWALGWHQCKYGYRNETQLRDVVKGYADNHIPLDTLWSDIDYMDSYKDFEYDKIRFQNLSELITELHGKNMKWVPILDAGIAMRPNQDYNAYKTGDAKGLFMKMPNGEYYKAQVWPNDAVFPDYFHPDTQDWLNDNIESLHKQLAFDGIWEDMNEAANFCNGLCYQSQKPDSPVQQKLKYIPTGRDLENKQMSLDAYHHDGNIQLDTHNLFGASMVKATHNWFVKNNKRTFIITRSSYMGTGKYGSKWLGDNYADNDSMEVAVSGVMLMNMFGIPLVGSDICGFQLDRNEDLCNRWHFVGAFYPFSRNHHVNDNQEPFRFSNDSMHRMTEAIKLKYSLIRYYYTQLFMISTGQAQTLYKPLFFEFPNDINATKNISYNMMLGSGLKASVNAKSYLENTTTTYYFPAGLWCGVSGNFTDTGDLCFHSAGETKDMPSFLGSYQLHIREGYVVPMQNTSVIDFNTSADLQNHGIDLHVLGTVSTGTSWNAFGDYINDDGLALNYAGLYNQYSFKASSASDFTITVTQSAKATGQTYSKVANCTAVNQNDFLEKIYFYNAGEYLINNTYTVNGFIYPNNTESVQVGTAAYEKETDRLVFAATEAICLSTIDKLQLVKQ